jgi:conjugative relaxase-like TrwC/TraI family protein
LEKDILVGMFEHSSSRGKDPHLHTHCVLANLTTCGRRLVVNNRYTLAAGYVYWRGLCEGLQQMGYDARPDMVRGIWIYGLSIQSPSTKVLYPFPARLLIVRTSQCSGTWPSHGTPESL